MTKFVTGILFYGFIKPLSFVPLPILYKLSDLLFLFNWYLIPYRKNLVIKNLRNSFPGKTKGEINAIAKKFYRHFFDLMIEGIYAFSISGSEAVKRFKLKNPGVLDDLYSQGRSVLIACGHYNNWEMAAVAFDQQIPHKSIGIYIPLANPFMDQQVRESRGKHGVLLIPPSDVKAKFETYKQPPIAMVFGTDQSPPRKSKNVFWTQFLNQDTAVLFGLEKYAREYNYQVVFMRIEKLKRGYYEYSLEVIVDNPKECSFGAITELHTKALESQILEKPEFWLWTHNRWKKKKTKDDKNRAEEVLKHSD